MVKALASAQRRKGGGSTRPLLSSSFSSPLSSALSSPLLFFLLVSSLFSPLLFSSSVSPCFCFALLRALLRFASAPRPKPSKSSRTTGTPSDPRRRQRPPEWDGMRMRGGGGLSSPFGLSGSVSQVSLALLVFLCSRVSSGFLQPFWLP